MSKVNLARINLALDLEAGPASDFYRGFRRVHETSSSADSQIVVRRTTGAAPESEGRPCWSHGALSIYSHGDRWQVLGGRSEAWVSKDGSRCEVSEPARESSRGWDRACASAALFLLLRTHQRFSLHASAAEWQGTNVLCVGPSGVGKTTLAVLMGLNGGVLRSDDTTLLELEAEWPLAQTVRIDRRSLQSRPELAAQAGKTANKSEFDLLRPEGGRFRADVLFFPERASHGGLHCERLSPGEALLRLTSASPFATERELGDPNPHLLTLSSLANRCEAYRVEAGPDLLANPKRLLKVLPRK